MQSAVNYTKSKYLVGEGIWIGANKNLLWEYCSLA